MADDDGEAPAAVCPLTWRDTLLVVASHLRAEELEPLRAASRASAALCADRVIGEGVLAQEDWSADADAFRRFSPQGGGGDDGEHASCYCRRRLRSLRLARALPELLTTWGVGGGGSASSAAQAPASGLAPLLFSVGRMRRRRHGGGDAAPAPAAPTGREADNYGLLARWLLGVEEWEGEEDRGDGETRGEPGGSNADRVSRCHIPGDLADLLPRAQQSWHCGPLVLFDRFDRISVSVYHELDIWVEARPTPSSAASSSSASPPPAPSAAAADSDDEEEGVILRRFPGALAEWNVGESLEEDLRAVRPCFEGQAIEAAPAEDPLALRPLQPRAAGGAGDTAGGGVAAEPHGIVVVERGRNTFSSKAAHCAHGGFAGVLVCDNFEGPLFRMAGNPEGDREDLPPTLLVPQSAKVELQALLRDHAVTVRSVGPSAGPCTFVAIGAMTLSEKGEEAEVWVVTDPIAETLGYVLLVPPAGPATVLARSVSAFMRDLVALDQENEAFLKQRAPGALASLREATSASGPEAVLRQLIPDFLYNGRSMMSSQQRGARRRASRADGVSGAWRAGSGEYVVRLRTRKVASSWIGVEAHAGGGAQRFRLLTPSDAMSLAAALETAGISADAAEVFVASGSFDVKSGPCILVEEQVGQSAGTEDAAAPKRRRRRRRGYRGAEAIVERVKTIAPSYLRQRWDEAADSSSGVSSCTVGVRNGQLCVRWASASGYRGSFQKPLRNLFELFGGVPPGQARSSCMLASQQKVLVLDTSSQPKRCSEADAAGGAGGWEEERSLEEPDGAWCLRPSAARDWLDGGRSAASAAESDSDAGPHVEGAEGFDEVTVLRSRAARHRAAAGGDGPGQDCGAAPLAEQLVRLENRSDYERFQVTPVHWYIVDALDGPQRGRRHRERWSQQPQPPPEQPPPEQPQPEQPATPPPPPDEEAVEAPSASASGRPEADAEADERPGAALSYRVRELPAGAVEVVVCVPGARSASELQLDVSGRRVQLTRVAGPPSQRGRRVDIALPRAVDPASTSARFSRARSELLVRLAAGGAAPP